ncbi:MAG: phasin family protein [Spirochaetes bacterium]|nr:phasin family protein [Spirochaetota bacterium]
MFQQLEKMLHLSAGLASLGGEKLEAMGKKIAEEAKLSETESKAFVDDLKKRSEGAKEAVEKKVKEGVDAALKKLDVPTRAEVRALEERLARLEQKGGA